MDFYCASARLCIEVDGDQHERIRERDEARDAYLLSRGILTLRFSSQECFDNPEGVALAIEKICRERTNQP